MRELTTDEVKTLLEAGVAEGVNLGKPVTLAVMDMGGNLRGLLRPEKGRISNIGTAEKKAWTAVAFQRPTAAVADIVQPGKPGYAMPFTDDRICAVAGGFPLFDVAGDVIGSVGASGGTTDEDVACCVAAMTAAGFAAPA
jgi:uncharacterized protein GlcG (DUF336 family)